MNIDTQMNANLGPFSRNWVWLLLAGLILLALGAAAISFSAFTTIISVVFIAIVILASGIVVIIDSFASWWGHWRGFTLHLLMGILYTAAGIVLLKNPLYATMSLTLLLGIMYLGLGIFRSFYSLFVRGPQWGWSLFSGLLAFLLGALILGEWPASSLFIIGLFVGVDLLIAGWVYIMAAFAVKRA